MREGERHPKGDGTLPGPGKDADSTDEAVQSSTVTPANHPSKTEAPANEEPSSASTTTASASASTIEAPARIEAPASGSSALPVAAAPNARTIASGSSESTLPQAETLAGPHRVADLPTLPRIDDSAYAIGEEIARGGMGRILFARDRKLRRDVVIKVMRRESARIDPRFERETFITARLQHPSIVRVYDAGVLGDGRAFYAMERVRGRSLEVVLGEAKTMRERLALLPHAIAVADAIAYAHSEGVLHRDLKPSNVLIGPFGETVVIDWGLAKNVNDEDIERRDETPGDSGTALTHETPGESSGARVPQGAVMKSGDALTKQGAAMGSGDALTQQGAVIGTPLYMAPEQARGEPADERTDVYALGALLYTVLTGSPPPRGATTEEVIADVAAGERVAILEREPELPPELAAIVEHAMAHAPAERFASAKELADELRSFAAGKLVASHSYTTGQLIRRWIGRHRVAVGVGAASVVVITLVGVLAIQNVMHERDVAEQARRDQERERDTLIYEQAYDALEADPSLTAAWLKRASDTALGWDKVNQLATDAATRGLAHVLRGHTQDVERIVVTPDATRIATGSDDGNVRWWNLATGTSIELAGHTGPIETMVMSSDAKSLATAGTDDLIWLWDLHAGTGRKLAGHTGALRGVAFSPDNKQLASTGDDGALWLWDVASGTGRKLYQHHHALRPLVWFDDHTIIVGSFDGMLGRFDTAIPPAPAVPPPGKPKPKPRPRPRRIAKKTPPKPGFVTGAMMPAQRAEIRCLALSPDRTYLVVGDEDGLATLWSADGKRVRTLGRHTDLVRDLIFTPDGTRVISAGGDAIVRVHSLTNGRMEELGGNASGIKDIALSSDGAWVASAGIDKTVHVWAIDGTLAHVFRGHSAAVKAVGFAKNQLVSGAEDDTVRVWQLAPGAPPRGPALRAWLETQTNVHAGRQRAPG